MFNRRRSNAECIHRTRLISVETDVAVSQKNTNAILLDRVWIYLCQSIVVAHAANTKILAICP